MGIILRNKIINECAIYTMLWCIYYLQGVLYSSGSIISQCVLLLILMLSLYYVAISFTKYEMPAFLKVVATFLVIFVAYTLVSYLDPTPIYKNFCMEERVTSFNTLKTVLISMLPIYAYYHFSRKGLITESNISRYLLCLLALATIMFIRKQNELMIQTTDVEEFTNNIAYDFLQLIPMLVFLKNKLIWQYTTLAYIVIFVLLGMKRGAILIGVLCLLYFIYQSYRIVSRKNKIRLVALVIIAIVGLSYFASDFIASSEYFQYRMEETLEGDTSGRNVIYSSLFNHVISRDSLGSILFGEGINHSVAIAGNYAHNDWLELAVNMGLLGILIYITYFTSLTRFTLNIKRYNRDKYVSLVLCLIVMFSTTLISMSYGSLSIGITLALGFNLTNTHSPNRIKQ